jgi:hypothetical protein
LVRRKTGLAILASAVVLVIIVAAEIGMVTRPGGQPVRIESSFSFDKQAAIGFYNTLRTKTGLLSVVPNSSVIYVADDQQLDYAALSKLGERSFANGIDQTILESYGGLYGSYNPSSCTFGYWNGVDVVVGAYFPIPCNGSSWNLLSGNQSSVSGSTLANGTGYTLLATLWTGSVGSDYVSYADLDLYYCLNQLHYGAYSDAVNAFVKANSYWNGQGFADRVYTRSGEYASYKLALDLIAFKALMDDPHTEASIMSYNSTLNQVQNMMSKLQGSDGGVITDYQILNGQLMISPNTYENGETTALFVLAE